MHDNPTDRPHRTPIACRPGLALCAVAAILLGGSAAWAQEPGMPPAPGGGGGILRHASGNGLLLGTGAAALWSYGRFTRDAYAFDTAAAFAVAPVLASRYGWKAGVPAYTVALMTGFGGTQDRPHHVSTVLAGAAVGLAVGGAVAHHRRSQFMPEHVYMGKRGLGLKFGF